jgi:hypothetical protein
MTLDFGGAFPLLRLESQNLLVFRGLFLKGECRQVARGPSHSLMAAAAAAAAAAVATP